MADTQRTQAAILALFANNTSGDISPQDLRDFVVSVMGGYGDLRSNAGGVVSSIGTSPVKVTAFDANGESDAVGVVPDHTNDQIVLGVSGAFEISVMLSTSAATDLEVFTFEVFVNGSPSGLEHSVASSGGDLKETVQIQGMLSLAAADVIDLRVNALAAGRSITVSRASMMMKRVG